MTDLDKLQALYEASPLARDGVTVISHYPDTPRTVVESSSVPCTAQCDREEDAEIIAGLINAWPAMLRELRAAWELREAVGLDVMCKCKLCRVVRAYDAARNGEP